MKSARIFFVLASVFGLTGVGLGAFGAHSLKSTISSEMLSVLEIGVRYQMYHTFALLFAAWFLQSKHNRKIELAGWCFGGGVVLFSGSLYLLAISSIRGLRLITPLGGLLLLAGWAMLAWGLLDKKSAE